MTPVTSWYLLMTGTPVTKNRPFYLPPLGRSRQHRYYYTSGVEQHRTADCRGWVTQSFSGNAGNEEISYINHGSGKLDDHDMSLDRRKAIPFSCSGLEQHTASSPSLGHFHTEFDGYLFTSTSHYSLGTNVPSLSSWTGLKNRALGSINISAPVVDVTLFIFELREFPSMLRDLGRYLKRELTASDVPGSFLSYKFGWAPLISDLRSLFDLSKSIHHRLRFLRDLKRGKNSRGGKFFHDESTWLNRSQSAFGLNIEYYRTDGLHAWWTSSIQVQDPTAIDDLIALYRSDLYSDGYKLLRRLTGTDTVSITTIWNALPWSWLIDYFISIGDFLELNSGLLPYDMKSLCLMQHGYSKEVSRVKGNSFGFTYTDSFLLQEKKYRRVYSNPMPGIEFKPILSNGQIAILGALVTAFLLRR